jgi:ABC-2 type transport system ATP-binding protein
MTLAIDVRGLTKRYNGRAVVDGVSLQVRSGRICGFLGPNGSGKTTTIRMLCGLLTPDAGEGSCLGHDLRHEIADRRAVVDRTLERLGLTGRQKQLAGALSGGWKQRLALAACLMHEPRLLLLDEPTAGVDPKARRDFWDEIHALAAQGITVLVSTHYMDEAERCHELCYIAYGKTLARGTEREIVEEAGLVVWAVHGSDEGALAPLVEPLKHADGVLSVAAFGNALHVAGRDAALVQRAIAPYRTQHGLRWERSDANLEDVFISLIATAQDNFGSGAAAGASR